MERDEQQRQRICQRIAELRQENGMTQEQLAEATGIARPHISRIEKGHHSIGFDILQRIGEALGADIDFVKRR